MHRYVSLCVNIVVEFKTIFSCFGFIYSVNNLWFIDIFGFTALSIFLGIVPAENSQLRCCFPTVELVVDLFRDESGLTRVKSLLLLWSLWTSCLDRSWRNPGSGMLRQSLLRWRVYDAVVSNFVRTEEAHYTYSTSPVVKCIFARASRVSEALTSPLVRNLTETWSKFLRFPRFPFRQVNTCNQEYQ